MNMIEGGGEGRERARVNIVRMDFNDVKGTILPSVFGLDNILTSQLCFHGEAGWIYCVWTTHAYLVKFIVSILQCFTGFTKKSFEEIQQ